MYPMGSKRTPWLKLGHPMSNPDIRNASKVEQRSSKKQEDIQSQFRVLQNDPKDSKSELQSTSNSITPNPLFIQEPQTPITVLRSSAEAKPTNLIKML